MDLRPINFLRGNIHTSLKALDQRVEEITYRYKTAKFNAKSARNVDIIAHDINTMEDEQIVPEAVHHTYDHIIEELNEIHADIIKVHQQLDKILQKTKTINRVELIKRQYNRLN